MASKIKSKQANNNPVIRLGPRRWYWRDTYHWILTLTWPRFLGLVIGIYLLTNLLFASAFFMVPGAVANARPGSFLDAFFFSIETLATVGYGYMNPGNTYGHIVASTEILIGMFGIAVVTGLLFARFSRPTARILFSDAAVITQFNGRPTLMLRVGNERDNLILEASVRAAMTRVERTQEGMQFNHIYDLKLARQHTSVFSLSWTIMHTIDEESPLFGKTQEQIHAERIGLSVAIAGVDDTINDAVHARRNYRADQIKVGHRFVDIIAFREGETPIMDFSKFHQTVPDGLH